MDPIVVVGALAALCSTASFAPQAWRIIRTRDTRGISRRMYAITVVGFSLWLAYGLLRRDPAIAIPNAICLALSGFILLLTLLPPGKRDAVVDAIRPEG